MKAKELEKFEIQKLKDENISVLNYWHEQEAIKNRAKQLEKEISDHHGKNYINWVNEFTDKIEKERDLIRERGTLNKFTDSQGRERKFKNDYAIQLQQQIVEGRNRKEKDNQMDPKYKEINQAYLNSLIVRNNTEQNPILGTSGTFNEALNGNFKNNL